jgi:hypothetical protein
MILMKNKNTSSKFMLKNVISILLLVLVYNATINAQDISTGSDQIKHKTFTRYYEFTWGTWPNIHSLSINYLSLSGLLNDGVSYAIKGSVIDGVAARLLNFFILNGFVTCFLMGTPEHELGHIGYAIGAGYKPHMASINVESIRKQYYVKTTDDNVLMYLGGGMNTDTYTAHMATAALYSGNDVPCYYNMIILYKKISNFEYVYSNDRIIRHPLGNIKEYYKNYDPVIYGVYLTMKYGYYDSFLPVWAYAPYFNKSLFVPANPYAYINPFFKDQYRRMKIAYLIELLDPSVIELFYGLRNYVKYGDLTFKPLMIPMGPVKFMPGTRASLGNSGVENYYDLYFSIQDMFQLNAYYRNGGNKRDTVHGCGIEVINIKLIDQLILSGRVDYWTLVQGSRIVKYRDYYLYNSRQPSISPGLFRKDFNNRNCFNIFIKLQWQFYQDWYITGGVGYKTYGALIGEQIDRGFYGYGGIGFNVTYGRL